MGDLSEVEREGAERGVGGGRDGSLGQRVGEEREREREKEKDGRWARLVF